MWKLDSSPEKSEVWAVLKRILRLGGTCRTEGGRSVFYFPYLHELGEGGPDEGSRSWNGMALCRAVLTGSNVNIRSKPSRDAAVIAQRSYETVLYTNLKPPVSETVDGETFPWCYVNTADGITGYMYGKFLYDSWDYRAGFSEEGGRWMMDFLVSGD